MTRNRTSKAVGALVRLGPPRHGGGRRALAEVREAA